MTPGSDACAKRNEKERLLTAIVGLNRRGVVAHDLASKVHHPDKPVNKSRAGLALLGLLRDRQVKAMQTLAEFVHGDRNDLAQVLIHDQRHTNARVLEEKIRQRWTVEKCTVRPT